MLSFTRYQNPETTVKKLLKGLSINIDPQTILEEMEKHPDYPSLLAVSDVLNNFGVKNSAYRVDKDKLANVPSPFIAHTNINGGDFLVVNKILGDSFIVSNEKWNRHKLNSVEFEKLFNGIILTTNPADTFEPVNKFAKALSSLKTPFIITGIVLVFLASLIFNTAYFKGLSWQLILLTLFKSAGLVTSVLLLIQSIDSNNPLVQKLCQSGSKSNCNAILSSKAAKVFEGLTWSEVGFFYFGGTWLLLLFGGGSTIIWLALAVLNVISLPYTFYSIYYQARVAKQWCVLCCTVQALLWLEFGPLITNVKMPLSFGDAGSLATIFTCLLLPVIIWMLLKPLFLKLQQLQPVKQQLRKFKYNTDLFENALHAQPKYAQPDDTWSIVLGNLEANNIITMVSNPYCGPCAKAHKELSELLEQNQNIQARIVFTTNNTDDDINNPVSRHLMALNELPDRAIVANALHDWYERKQRNYAEWARVYPIQLDEANFYKLDKQNAWCQMAEVSATPTMLINGHRLPDLYRLPDLKYMLQ